MVKLVPLYMKMRKYKKPERVEVLCYLCNKNNGTTRDHVPPKNLFPIGSRKNLITVPCCNDCNQKNALDDEAFRIYVTASINRSREGEEVWKDGVLKSSFKRSKKLRKAVKKAVSPIYQPNGTFSGNYSLGIPKKRANAYLIRITKGLTRKILPEINYAGAVFGTAQIEMSDINPYLGKMTQGEIGNGVFRYWYWKNQGHIVWVYQFYDAGTFIVKFEQKNDS